MQILQEQISVRVPLLQIKSGMTKEQLLLQHALL